MKKTLVIKEKGVVKYQAEIESRQGSTVADFDKIPELGERASADDVDSILNWEEEPANPKAFIDEEALQATFKQFNDTVIKKEADYRARAYNPKVINLNNYQWGFVSEITGPDDFAKAARKGDFVDTILASALSENTAVSGGVSTRFMVGEDFDDSNTKYYDRWQDNGAFNYLMIGISGSAGLLRVNPYNRGNKEYMIAAYNVPISNTKMEASIDFLVGITHNAETKRSAFFVNVLGYRCQEYKLAMTSTTNLPSPYEELSKASRWCWYPDNAMWVPAGTGNKNRCEVRRTGNIVTLSGYVTPTLDSSLSSDTQNICTLPKGFRPDKTQVYPQMSFQWINDKAQGYYLRIDPDGVVSMSKFNIGGLPAKPIVGKEYGLGCSWYASGKLLVTDYLAVL